MPLAASIVAAGKKCMAKLLLSALWRLKAAGLCVPWAGSVVRYFFAAGSVRTDGWQLSSTVGLVILAALVTLGAGQPLSVLWCSSGFWPVRS